MVGILLSSSLPLISLFLSDGASAVIQNHQLSRNLRDNATSSSFDLQTLLRFDQDENYLEMIPFIVRVDVLPCCVGGDVDVCPSVLLAWRADSEAEESMLWCDNWKEIILRRSSRLNIFRYLACESVLTFRLVNQFAD
jgi:hypothetical protein